MYKKFKCEWCGFGFDEPCEDMIFHNEVDTRCEEYVSCCPKCKSVDFYEWSEFKNQTTKLNDSKRR